MRLTCTGVGIASCSVGDTPTSAIGIAASAHLAAIAPTCTYIEFLPHGLSDSRLRRELVPDELPVVDGVIPLPTKPGLGITVSDAALEAFTVA